MPPKQNPKENSVITFIRNGILQLHRKHVAAFKEGNMISLRLLSTGSLRMFIFHHQLIFKEPLVVFTVL